MPSIEAFGERKLVLEWAKDRRCVVKYGKLVQRLSSGWDPEEAISTLDETKDRVYIKPPLVIEAFGEEKTAGEWAGDERVKTQINVFLRRIQHGWMPETAFTTPVTPSKGRTEVHAPKYELDGENKTLKDWALDSRCEVSEMTLRKNVQSGMPISEAFQFRRRPGRTLGVGKEDIGREVDDLRSILKMMTVGGELWVYEAGETKRISLIYNDVRNIVDDETFSEMRTRDLIAKVFETDTITNYELTQGGIEEAG
jgi:hypothetical protein